MRQSIRPLVLIVRVFWGFYAFAALGFAEVNPPASLREAELLERIAKLEERLALLESKISGKGNGQKEVVAVVSTATQGAARQEPALDETMRGVTLSADVDGYYAYNFNKPAGRVNQLRAYDVTHNGFSLNQAGLILERAVDLKEGRRYGARLDLMYGQATETLQGSSLNEPRAQVYRPVFQAYGTYVFPIGKGLTVDFGKFASALGFENNYTKDQINYSRSYYFNYLPFYHFGFRSTYDMTEKLVITYWLVNGANQSEDFNGFRSQAAILTIKPTAKTSWNLNYYVGHEQPRPEPASGLGTPRGRFHVFDTYLAWSAGERLTLAAEYDYVVNRVRSNDSPARVHGGVGYAKYQFTPKFYLGSRFAYLSDRGGLFSGQTQALKDTTLTAAYQFAPAFQMRAEWRRDFSNQPYFQTRAAGRLKKEQNTATLGLIWWFGGKQRTW